MIAWVLLGLALVKMLRNFPDEARLWIGRLALIPLVVYALGTPMMVALHGTVTLQADSLLPFELLGLLVCCTLVLWGQN